MGGRSLEALFLFLLVIPGYRILKGTRRGERGEDAACNRIWSRRPLFGMDAWGLVGDRYIGAPPTGFEPKKIRSRKFGGI